MLKKLLCFVGASLLGVSVWASGSTYSRVKTWSNGDTLTAGDLNSEFNNILNNGNPAGMDDYSNSLTEMRTTEAPYPASVESQPTSLQGELTRLRYQILQLNKAISTGRTYWYDATPTEGVFTVKGSSVGVNQTSPATYTFDVTGNERITGASTIGGGLTVSTITSTLSTGISIATHTTITGNLTVTGSINNASATRIRATMSSDQTGNASSSLVLINTWTDVFDTLGEMGTTTFTVTTAGYYDVCFMPAVARSSTGLITSGEAAVFVNGALTLGKTWEGLDGGSGNASHITPTFCALMHFAAADAVTFKAKAAVDGSANFDIKNDDGSVTQYGTLLTIAGR